jgi:nicotinamidase-related amidase
VVFTRDCTATFTKAEHEAALQNIDQFFGQVVSADEVAACWPARASQKAA